MELECPGWKIFEQFIAGGGRLFRTREYVFANFIDADKRIKGIQIRNHEIKLVNFADGITFFLADITCLNRIHMI